MLFKQAGKMCTAEKEKKKEEMIGDIIQTTVQFVVTSLPVDYFKCTGLAKKFMGRSSTQILTSTTGYERNLIA